MAEPKFLQLHQPDAPALVAEAVAGLLLQTPQLSPKFFYDELGSRLFDAITALDEYYPTRTEAAIVDQHIDAIAAAVHAALPARFTLVDLGAGNCAKAARLFAPLRPAAYVALDISVDFVRAAIVQLQRQHEGIAMTGVGLDFATRLALPAGVFDGPALVFYPGSSIGNFDPEAALSLLRQARALAAGGALLIGVDLVKDEAVLQAAYDDALGVTAAFNRNLLRHLNRVVGSDFDIARWQHVARFDRATSRIEMHLQAAADQRVAWPGGGRRFAAGERIHTENSYKWRRGDFEALLRDAGFAKVRSWSDAHEWFGVMLAQG